MEVKKSHRYLVILAAAFALSFPAFSKETVVESKWASTPVIIDGFEEDWAEMPLTLEEKTLVNFAFRNDASNLYLLFIFNDPKFLSTIDATGITLWFNAEGKKKKEHGIRFFKRVVTADELLSRFEKQGQILSEEQKAELKSKLHYLLYDSEVMNEKETKSTELQPGAESMSPTFKGVKKAEISVYEFRIPLGGQGQPVGIGTEPGKSIEVGFEWGGLTKEMQAKRIKRTADVEESGFTSEVSSGEQARKSDARYTPADSTQETGRGGPKKYSFWVDVKLAQNQ